MILLAMTGYFAGAVQAPLTAVIIVMEMSRDLATLLPLMLTALLASNVARLVSPHSLCHALAEAFPYSHREEPPEARPTP
ncbi:H+/Cl- antiporter ClcA [Azospirillum rugosum]|uniref:H+/Cl- antiporter ClcA n=1 Tax=Azospirillum rugosum TaxID=416170 RepID=A0ABS4SW72_9PROT|nr:H+/Cl- antiporter ClcA [Azospirillum rugosum]MDQ0530426.1 H+/Cl- antiporter ClcA [Azospirillum rugosum]